VAKLAITVFNIGPRRCVQTPPDSGRPHRAAIMLTGGLILSGADLPACSPAAGLMVLINRLRPDGVANTVYHPADYAILRTPSTGKKNRQGLPRHIRRGIYEALAWTPQMVLARAALWGLARASCSWTGSLSRGRSWIVAGTECCPGPEKPTRTHHNIHQTNCTHSPTTKKHNTKTIPPSTPTPPHTPSHHKKRQKKKKPLSPQRQNASSKSADRRFGLD